MSLAFSRSHGPLTLALAGCAHVDTPRTPERKVEADTQRCVRSRVWNDPNHDGWQKGRS